jgi:hypothetical protein
MDFFISIQQLNQYEETSSSTSYCFNTLARNPLFEIRLNEPDSGSSQLYERDTALLYEASHESFGTTQTVRRGPNV